MSWTEGDYSALMRDRKQTAFAEARATIQSAKPEKIHKFHAKPCIVTADLTLFTKHDIYSAATIRRVDLVRSTTPLKELAQACGIIGEWFGSEKEGKRWIILNQQQRIGAIMGLRRQVDFDLTAHGQHICRWRADFCYDEKQKDGSWESIHEDAKGYRTADYKLKKRLFEAERRVTIRET